MSIPTTAEDFLQLLRASRLLSVEQLDSTLQSLQERGQVLPADANGLADLLTTLGVLTPFQQQQLMLGRYAGFWIGKYRILSRIGSGGMGNVFLAEHVVMKRKVAIKTLTMALRFDPTAVARFYREARAVAALDHPNIVRAFDVDEHNGIYYLVMEYVPGMSLQDWVTRLGPMPWPYAAECIRQGAAGLAHAAEAGLVHRDIKPGNFVIDHKGVVKLLDLGLAVFYSSQSENETPLTKALSQQILGTADYLAPEQAIDSHEVDIKADVYSLGGTFYFLMTGLPPFPKGTMAQKLLWHQTKEPKPLAELVADVPTELIQILNHMMVKDSKRRPTPVDVELAMRPFAKPLSDPFAGLSFDPLAPPIAPSATVVLNRASKTPQGTVGPTVATKKQRHLPAVGSPTDNASESESRATAVPTAHLETPPWLSQAEVETFREPRPTFAEPKTAPSPARPKATAPEPPDVGVEFLQALLAGPPQPVAPPSKPDAGLQATFAADQENRSSVDLDPSAEFLSALESSGSGSQPRQGAPSSSAQSSTSASTRASVPAPAPAAAFLDANSIEATRGPDSVITAPPDDASFFVSDETDQVVTTLTPTSTPTFVPEAAATIHPWQVWIMGGIGAVVFGAILFVCLMMFGGGSKPNPVATETKTNPKPPTTLTVSWEILPSNSPRANTTYMSLIMALGDTKPGQRILLEPEAKPWPMRQAKISAQVFRQVLDVLIEGKTPTVELHNVSDNAPLLVLDGVRKLTLKRLILDNQGKPGPVLELKGLGLDEIVLEELVIRNYTGPGIHIYQNAASFRKPLQLRKIRFEGGPEATSGISLKEAGRPAEAFIQMVDCVGPDRPDFQLFQDDTKPK